MNTIHSLVSAAGEAVNRADDLSTIPVIYPALRRDWEFELPPLGSCKAARVMRGLRTDPFATDPTGFSASPHIADHRIIIRSQTGPVGRSA